MSQTNVIILSIHILIMVYLTGFASVFVIKTLVMNGLDLKYDLWRGRRDGGFFNLLPKYFCEWCFLFWVSVIIILIFCSIFGFWYLIITPLFSTPVALSKYK